MVRLILAFAAFTFLTEASRAQDAGKPSRQWNFDGETPGESPAGFRSAVGKWLIAADGKNRVLAQTAQNADSVFNLILRPDVMYADVEVSVRLKAVAGIVDQGG